jgi:diguanylate cyclase (GGDEF)-like protein/PAS domain S-box-containing protein
MTVRRKSASNPVAHRADKRLRAEKRRRLGPGLGDLAAGHQSGQVAQQDPEAGTENGERRFRATFDLVPVGITHIDPEGRILLVNPHMEKILGYPSSELVGRRMGEFVWPGDQEVRRELLARRAELHAGKIHSFTKEIRYRRKNGSPVWVGLTIAIQRDSAGRLLYDITAAEDITARKRDEQLLALEHEVNRCIANAETESAAVQAAIRAICEKENWESGRYWRVDEKAGVLRLGEVWSVPGSNFYEFLEQWRVVVYRPGEGLAGKAWQSGEPQWAADLTQDSRLGQKLLALRSGFRGVFAFPVISEGKPIGVLVFNSREIRQRQEELVEAIRVIGGQMGQFLKRKQAEEMIRDQARRQRLIAEFGQQVLASTDLADVLNRAVDLVSGTLNSDFCNLLELDRDGKHLMFRAAVGWPEEWIGRRTVPVQTGTRADLVLSRREPLIVEDYDRDTDASSPFLREFGVRSGIVAPLFGTTGTFGILSAHALQPRRFSEDEVSFLRNVAYIVAVAIERSKSEERLAYLAQFDALTGLPNRHLFHDRLTQTMVQAKRSGRPMAMLFIDLDRFKLVNDTLGHGTGDRLLKEAATRLTQCVRSGDTVGRFGGDEFGAILADLGAAGDAGLVAQKIIEALERPFSLEGNETYVTASIGITLFPDDGEEAGALIMNSDTAMYRAKEQGRNNYQYFTREMNERALARVQMEAALRRAIERREFRLFYQPKVDLRNGEICGAEALLRWQHPDRGMIAPEEFIPILEDTGLIVPVGEWVMREACSQTMAWKRSGLSVLPVAVNLSARQFQQKDLESRVRYVLTDSGVDPSLIEFELTESLLMKDPEAAARSLRGLKRAGARISVDDFGTGYSSLAYLKRFPIDALKIDGAFIRDLTTDPGDAAITLAIIGLAHGLKLKVVAECVETESQLNFLSTHACDEMQGYYFSEPAPAAEIEAMLREGRRLRRSAGEIPTRPPVLLLDDSEQDLLLLEEILRVDGFPVLKATDTRRAFEVLAGQPVGIAISDQGMPGMSGVEFLGHVRKLYPDVVRILATGTHDPRAIADAVNEAGIQKFLSKDWDGERLRTEVREIYRKHFLSEDTKPPVPGARSV